MSEYYHIDGIVQDCSNSSALGQGYLVVVILFLKLRHDYMYLDEVADKHANVIKGKHFPLYWLIVRGNHS